MANLCTQPRYPIALFVLLNACDATSDPSIFICPQYSCALNIHVPSEVSTEPDLSFDGFFIFELCEISRIV